jgi:hypothetical protein
MESPRLSLYYNFDNKRRLHISKLHSHSEEKDNIERSRGPNPGPYPQKEKTTC